MKLGVKGRSSEGLSQGLGTGSLFLGLQCKEYTGAFFTLSISTIYLTHYIIEIRRLVKVVLPFIRNSPPPNRIDQL